MNNHNSYLIEWIGFGILAILSILLLWWTNPLETTGLFDSTFTIPSSFKNFTTIFLSIFFEAIPFILLGTLVSSLIQVYVSTETIHRLLPKHSILAIFPAIFFAALFPICECAIIPVVRRLIQKGMPAHIGIIFLIATPILNPVVALSTHLAFRMQPYMLYSRIGLASITAIGISLLVYKWSKTRPILKNIYKHAIVEHSNRNIWTALYHAIDEFFDVAKYVIMGALLAAMAQVTLDREMLGSLATNPWTASLVMMGTAFILSVCSEADAFVASSFSALFPFGSLTAFLVFGAIFDIKNMFLLLSTFHTKFVFFFMTCVICFVLIGSVILHYFVFS
jgi:uncharacterized membrane protein YraQ (UPF0718 family)